MSEGATAARVRSFGAALVFAVVGITLATAACRKIWGIDFWWQYATGRLVAEQGVPSQDAFSYTMPTAEWIELRWLYCWSIYRVEQLAGFAGLTLVKCTAVLATFGFAVFGTRHRPGAETTGAVVLIAVLCAMQRFFLRPELVTFLCFAIFVWILRRQATRGSRMIWWLPVLQVAWTNAHTVFVLGPLLVGLHVVVCGWERVRGGDISNSRPRTAAITLGLTLAACLVNPYGVSGALFPFTLYGEIQDSGFKDFIEEFKSPFAFTGFAALVYYKVLLGVCVAAAAANYRRLDPFWTALVLSQFYLSTLAIRNLPLFALAAIPFVLDNLARSPLWSRLRGRAAVRVTLLVAVVGGSAFYTFQLFTNRLYLETGDTNRTGLGLAPHRYPEAAAAFMEQNGMTGPCLHTFLEGSYLTSRGVKVFMDPRLEVYGEEHFLRYMRILDGEEDWRAVVQEYGVDVALLDAHSKLAEALIADDAWTLRYFDACSVVLARRERYPNCRPLRNRSDYAAAVRRIRADLPRAPVPGIIYGLPQPYLRVAGFLLKRGRGEFAASFLEDARTAYRDTEEIRRGLQLVAPTGKHP